MKTVLVLGFALFLGRPALAQDEKCVGGPPGSKCGPASDTALDLRVKFDKETVKGEVKCTKGKLKDGSVEYLKCMHHKLDMYDSVAIKKKIIASKEKYDSLDNKKKKLAKKLALYDSAHKELKKELSDLGEDKSGEIEYKKKVGALKKIDQEFDKALSDCGKEDTAVFTCPVKA